MNTTESVNVLNYKLAREKLNRANAAMKWAQISTADDPRIELTREYNEALSRLTDNELDALGL